MSYLEKVYPEIHAGGFSREDSTISFYTRVNSLVDSNSHVLDLGAGRGAMHEMHEGTYKGKLCSLFGRVEKLVGLDVDPAVLQNKWLDAAKCYDGGAFPFSDNSFDLIYCDWVVEHIDAPLVFSSEVYRVLKPGGWFCARTPNKYGYVGLATNAIPNFMHAKVVEIVQPGRQEKDVFPTRYRLNTVKEVKRFFPDEKFKVAVYTLNSEPGYTAENQHLTRLMRVFFRLVPEYFGAQLHIFAQRR